MTFQAVNTLPSTHEIMDTDVIIVGAGPAGLSAAIKIKQLDASIDVIVIDKAAHIGGHILSGCVFNPIALETLFPDWEGLGAPLSCPVRNDYFKFLTKTSAWNLPIPKSMRNPGHYIISLSELCRWMALQAENLGVNIFPGFAATSVLLDNNNRVCGIMTGDKGVAKSGQTKENFQSGIAIRAKSTLLSEGCRGSLSERVIEKYHLRDNASPQTYALGIKEIWKIEDERLHFPGLVMHSVGWPLSNTTYGGAFLYQMEGGLVSVGMVVGLDYSNPTLNPFEELQRFKTHPEIKPLFESAKRISYGARTLNEGGWQSIPTLNFPGGALLGCSAGFVNVPKLKGSHYAMQSGILAAISLVQSHHEGQSDLIGYDSSIRKSWVGKELFRARNIRPAFRKNFWLGLLYAGIDHYVFRGYAPWTFKHKPDHLCLQSIQEVSPIDYPKPDNVITFDKLSSIFLSTIHHPDNQPCHLQLRDPTMAIEINWHQYHSPEQYYCPANVYEVIDVNANEKQLQINSQNCIHCKACDIKDPTQNIRWVPPEGGSGPNYTTM